MRAKVVFPVVATLITAAAAMTLAAQAGTTRSTAACTSSSIGFMTALTGAGAPFGQEQLGRIGHLDEPAIGHLEDADLVGRAKAVLYRPQDAELMSPIALEIEHRVNHVLEHAGPRDHAFLGDVTD